MTRTDTQQDKSIASMGRSVRFPGRGRAFEHWVAAVRGGDDEASPAGRREKSVKGERVQQPDGYDKKLQQCGVLPTPTCSGEPAKAQVRYRGVFVFRQG